MQRINLLQTSLEYREILSAKNNPQGTIIYIHGFGGNLERVNYLAENLKNYNFYAINLPFHGGTQFSNKNQVNVFYYAKLLNEFISQKSLKNVMALGHSMGAAVVMVAYRDQPQNYQNLILVGPLNKTSQNLSELFISGFYSETLEKRLDFMDKIFYDATERKNDATLIKESLNYVNLLKTNNDFKTTIKELGLHIISDEVLDAVEIGLEKITIPTLVVYGEGDNIIDQKNIYQYFQKHSPHAEIAIITKSGHTPWDENPDDFFTLITNFLKKHSKIQK